MGKGRTPGAERPMPSVDNVEPMRALSVDEQEAFDAWRETIRETRAFLSTDRPLLMFLTELTVRKQRALATIEKEGSYIEGRRHPALTDYDNAHRDTMAVLREMGLTPASFKNVRSSTRRVKGRDSLDDFISTHEGN